MTDFRTSSTRGRQPRPYMGAKLISALAIATAAPVGGFAQSSTSAPVGQSQTSTSSGGNLLSKLNYTISQQFIGETAARSADERNVTLGDGSPNVRFDRDASYFDSITSLGASYKFQSGNSLAVIQRIGYTYTRRADRQLQASLSAIRIHYTLPISALGADGNLTVRVAPAHTHALYHDSNMIGTLALIPALSWKLNPDLSISYSGYLGGTFYNGKQREATASHQLTASDARDAGVLAARAKIAKTSKIKTSELSKQQLDAAEEQGAIAGQNDLMTKRFTNTAQQRNFYVLTNAFAVNYQISPKIKIGQGIGYGIISKEYNNSLKTNPYARSPIMHTAQSMYGELATTMGIQVAKQVSVDLAVQQAHPFLEGSGDPSTGKPYFYRDGYSLYYPEQTTYSVTTAFRF